MGKAWGHIGNLLIIWVVVISKEIAAEASRRNYNTVVTARKEVNGLADEVFGKKQKNAKNK